MRLSLWKLQNLHLTLSSACPSVCAVGIVMRKLSLGLAGGVGVSVGAGVVGLGWILWLFSFQSTIMA